MITSIRRSQFGSRAFIVLLLLLSLLVQACAASPAGGEYGAASKETGTAGKAQVRTEDTARDGSTRAESGAGKGKKQEEASGDSKGFPEYRDFYSKGDPKTPAKFVSSDSSTGAIPVVEPFNFGRDPGGPEDKTLYLTVPKLGLTDVPVFDTLSEDKLRNGTVHIPATGYPWQKGANVFIAGHRIGYANTASHYVFFHLDWLKKGNEIQLQDADGKKYLYRVTKRTIVGPDNVEVMNPVQGRSLVTLQTCTLPDYENRLIVQGELVEKKA